MTIGGSPLACSVDVPFENVNRARGDMLSCGAIGETFAIHYTVPALNLSAKQAKVLAALSISLMLLYVVEKVSPRC